MRPRRALKVLGFHPKTVLQMDEWAWYPLASVIIREDATLVTKGEPNLQTE
jgi:hypothetical protein